MEVDRHLLRLIAALHDPAKEAWQQGNGPHMAASEAQIAEVERHFGEMRIEVQRGPGKDSLSVGYRLPALDIVLREFIHSNPPHQQNWSSALLTD